MKTSWLHESGVSVFKFPKPGALNLPEHLDIDISRSVKGVSHTEWSKSGLCFAHARIAGYRFERAYLSKVRASQVAILSFLLRI